MNINYLIIATTVIFMVLLFFWDIISHRGDSHRDFSSLIVSTGVLGTFLGILVGLSGFDSTNIAASVPLLLEGLKTAFITSVFGMALAVILSLIHKNSGGGDEEIGVLNKISKKLEALSEIQKYTKHLELIPLINTKLDFIDTNVRTLSSDITSVKDELKQNQEKLSKLLSEKLETIDGSLKEAVKTLAKGATDEIIKALENVIGDFNKNLTEQFGENFKQLNAAVMNMIEWQENYKDSIQKFEKSLAEMLSNTENSHQQTVDSINQSFTKFSETNQIAIDSTISKIQMAAEESTNHLKMHTESLLGTVKEANVAMSTTMQQQSALTTETNAKTQEILIGLEESLKVTKENANQIKEITDDYKTIAAISGDLKSIIKTNQNQIQNLESHLESLTKVGQDANQITEALADFSKTIQGSLTEQADSVATLTKTIEDQLPSALEALEESLTAITQEFATKYKEFMDDYAKLKQADAE